VSEKIGHYHILNTRDKSLVTLCRTVAAAPSLLERKGPHFAVASPNTATDQNHGIDRLPLGWIWVGNRTCRKCLVLHGGPGRGRDDAHVARRMRRLRLVITPCRGYAGSGTPPPVACNGTGMGSNKHGISSEAGVHASRRVCSARPPTGPFALRRARYSARCRSAE
jgi:hypothetical protein